MNHEDWNWRRLNLEMALQTAKALKVSGQSSAFALDDSIKMRSGKKCLAYPVTLITPRDGASWGSRF